MKKALIILIAQVLIACPNLYAQNRIIQGTVKHLNTRLEISGVNIYIKGTTIGTTTNSDGHFLLTVLQPRENMLVVFEHVSFFKQEILLNKAKNTTAFYLKPRVILLPGIKIEAAQGRPKIVKDIPQSYSIINEKNFEARGFTDIGDLLRTEHGIQIEESQSGKKSIGIRGGNADDVIILFDGIRLNNLYDNIFDLSILNLDDIGQIEIIKGSNSALYGAEAISGVINIVPKSQKNYKVKFQQKVGSYSSGDWNVNLNHTMKEKLNLSFSFRKSGSLREYPSGNNNFMENQNSYQNAGLKYNFSPKNGVNRSLNLTFFRTDLNYENNRFNESFSNLNEMFYVRYTGNIGRINNLNLMGSYNHMKNNESLSLPGIFTKRVYDNRTTSINFEKDFLIKNLELLFAYQFENGELDFLNDRELQDDFDYGVKSALFTRQKHGIVSILKWHMEASSGLMKFADLDISYRGDRVTNKFWDVFLVSPKRPQRNFLKNNSWTKSMLKFSGNLSGISEDYVFNVFLNYGTNYKFPTMSQQISLPLPFGPASAENLPILNPEKNSSLEIGLDITRETPGLTNLEGWQLKAALFKNDYTNKIRIYHAPNIPIAYVDNIHDAGISGFETKVSLFFLQKKLTVAGGSSIYSIPEKAAFPFKSERKFVMDILVEHAGFSFLFFWFHESDQLGWVRDMNRNWKDVILPGYSNLDIHLSKHFRINKLRFISNFSGRNLLDNKTKIEDLAIRDRRFYLTFGVQY